jgi:hypothetical protein
MSIPHTPSEPTIADLLAELRLQRLETRTETLELKAALTDLRSEIADLRSDYATFRFDMTTRLTTLFDEVAAFRAEYNGHTHDD